MEGKVTNDETADADCMLSQDVEITNPSAVETCESMMRLNHIYIKVSTEL